jgi:hypothetical protein
VKSVCAIDAFSGRRAKVGKGSSVSEIVTANRLVDGVVVFQNALGGWEEDFALAAVYADLAARDAALRRAREAAAQSLIVDPYAVAVERRAGGYAPTTLRETIRAAGPTVRRDLGKQAAGLAPAAALAKQSEASHVPL